MDYSFFSLSKFLDVSFYVCGRISQSILNLFVFSGVIYSRLCHITVSVYYFLNYLYCLVKCYYKALVGLAVIGFAMFTYNNVYMFALSYMLIVFVGVFQLAYITVHTYLVVIVLTLLALVISVYTNLFTLVFFNNGVFVLDDLNALKVTNTLTMGFGLQFSYMSLSFAFLTLWIALFANIFSSVYVRNEVNPEKFVYFLNIFIISMVLLVLSSNWGVLIFGWECIGISSYLLINFWTHKVSTFKAAFKAFSFNKLSDLGVLISCFIYLNLTNDSSFSLISLNKVFFLKSVYLFSYQWSVLTIFVLSLCVAAACKSAQLGFHIWLPDSMEAPVPASALIHSATLVSAGIFILLKFWVIIKYSYNMYNIILLWSLLTTLYGAIVAAHQVDLKRTLAYSTISHCGYIIFSIFLENPVITVMYLYAHGIYKAFSFMALGNIIYGFGGVQDIRKVSGVFFFKKINFFILFYTLFSLSSAPISISFLIKHSLINCFFQLYVNYFFLSLILLSSCTGIVYSIRLLFNLFFSFNKLWCSFFNYKYINFVKLYRFNLVSMDMNITIFLLIGVVLSHYLLLIFIDTDSFYSLTGLSTSLYIVSSLPSSILGMLQAFLIGFILTLSTFFLKNINYQTFFFVNSVSSCWVVIYCSMIC